ncbi:MAG: hypothetical protein U1E65_20280 [Myxococcota bacterium]
MRAAALLLWVPLLACQPVQTLPGPQTSGARSMLFVVAVGSDVVEVEAAEVSAAGLVAAPAFSVDQAVARGVVITALRYDCSLEELGLSPGRQTLVPSHGAIEVPIAKSASRLEFAADNRAWADTDAESDAIEGLLERLPIAPGHLCEQGGANYDSTDVMLSADGEDGLENRIVLSVTSLADGSALISTTGTAAGARIRPRIFRVNEAGAVTVIETGLGATQDDGAFVARRPDGTLYLGTLDGRLFRGTLEQGFVSFGPHLTMRQDGDRHESMYDFEIVPDQEAFWVVSHIRGPRLRRADSASVVELDDDLGFLELSLFNAPSGELLLTTVDNRPLRRIHWSEGTLLASANDVLPPLPTGIQGIQVVSQIAALGNDLYASAAILKPLNPRISLGSTVLRYRDNAWTRLPRSMRRIEVRGGGFMLAQDYATNIGLAFDSSFIVSGVDGSTGNYDGYAAPYVVGVGLCKSYGFTTTPPEGHEDNRGVNRVRSVRLNNSSLLVVPSQ